MDEARLLGAALRDREEQAHPFFAARGAVEHGELEAGLAGDLLGEVGEALRGQDAGRFVDQAARLADRSRGLLRARDGGVRLFGGGGVAGGRRAEERQALDGNRRSLAGIEVLVEPVEAE